MAIEAILRSPDGVAIYEVARAQAHRALAELLAARCNCDPAALRLERTPNGKPFVPGAPEFSLTYARNLGFIAIGDRRPIGIDVEPLEPIPELLAVAADFFEPAQHAKILALDGEARVREFYRAWVALEATLKARGARLADGCRPSGPVWTFEPADGFIGALAAA